MSYEKKILQMKQLLKKKDGQSKAEKVTFIKPKEPFYTQKWHDAGMKRLENDWGVVFLKETHYPLDFQHGKYQLGQFYDAIAKWDVYEEQHPLKLTSDDSPLFYDTETTGLKGTGTHIFLNGILEESSQGFTLKQYVLADPSNETAFLYESKFWQGEKMVITYNGKSFDWPQLQTRWTLNRQNLPPLREQKHMDLFHSSKRIWKNDLLRMKLSTVEAEKLDFHRVDDMPGYLAPMIYLDAVRSGDTEMLLQILKHNEYDLLSLITLFIQATELVFADVSDEQAVVHTNIGKWYNDLKQTEKGNELLHDVSEQFNDEEAALANYLRANHLKKNHLFDEAIDSYTKALPFLDERQWVEASIELAKLYEHQLKDFDEAEKHILNALFRVKKSTIYKDEAKVRKIEQIEKRFLRVRKKQG